MRILAPLSTGVFALALATTAAPAAQASSHHRHGRHGASASGERSSSTGSTKHAGSDGHTGGDGHAQGSHSNSDHAGSGSTTPSSGDQVSSNGKHGTPDTPGAGQNGTGTTPNSGLSEGSSGHSGSGHSGSGHSGSGHSGSGHSGSGTGGSGGGHGGGAHSGDSLPLSPTAPVLGHRVAVAPVPPKPGQPPAPPALVRLPGTHQIAPLTSVSALPVGTVIDARTSPVTLVTAKNRSGDTQGATFWGGMFTVQQGPNGMTNITPVHGSFVGCAGHTALPSGSSATTSNHARGHVIRSLWATDNHGKFRTHGRNSVATVRGTAWITVETCDGTTTYVVRGAVAVRDKHRHTTVVVAAGHQYFAPSPQP